MVIWWERGKGRNTVRWGERVIRIGCGRGFQSKIGRIGCIRRGIRVLDVGSCLGIRCWEA